MLFPARPTGPQTCIELDTEGGVLPTVTWTGLVSDGRADPGGLPALPNGPGMPLRGVPTPDITAPERNRNVDNHIRLFQSMTPPGPGGPPAPPARR